MNHIEQSIELISSGRDKITRSKHLILMRKFQDSESIKAVNKAIDKALIYKVKGYWINSHYETIYNELVNLRDLIIDKDFPELKSYIELAKK